MRSPTDVALLLGAAILGVAALWHIYWAIGGKIGLLTAVPERHGKPLFVPGRLTTGAVGVAIGASAALYAAIPLGVVPGFVAAVRLAVGGLGLVFLARAIGDFGFVGFFKRHTGTRFADADSRYFAPLCLFLGVTGLSAAAPIALSMIG